MNSYFISIKNALIVFPILALILTIPYMIIQYHKYGAITKKRVLIVYSFIFYLLCAYFLVILPLPKNRNLHNYHYYNLKLFEFVKEIQISTNFNITNPQTYINLITSNKIIEPLFNILMTIPFGIYLKYYFKKSTLTTIFYTFLLSLFFELTQLTGLYYIYTSPYRMFDVNDLFNNTLGGFIGCLIAPLLTKFLPSKEELDEEVLTKGKKVSFTRRFIAYLLDLFFIIFILFILNKYISYLLIIIIIFIYFSCLPMINGQTLGKKIVNIKISASKKAIFLRGLIYNLLYLNIFLVLLTLNNYIKLSIIFIILFQITFYLILIFNIIIEKYNQTRTLLVDKILKTKIVDTIKHEETYIIKL